MKLYFKILLYVMLSMLGTLCLTMLILRFYLVFSTSSEPLYYFSPLSISEILKDKKILEIKTKKYITELEKNHLSQGMVQSTIYEDHLDVCDSLLFSGIYHYSLNRLGEEKRAKNLWTEVQKSRRGPYWYRHPACPSTPLSRDMLLGLFLIAVDRPEKMGGYLVDLSSLINKRYGFFSKQYRVGFATFEIRNLLSQLAEYHQSPKPFNYFSFSTTEIELFYPQPGYTQHLAALKLLLEYELGATKSNSSLRFLFPDMKAKDAMILRSGLVSYRLAKENPKNAFFVYLYLKFHNKITPETLNYLTKILLDEKLFPSSRLPNLCDRKADYLWQRKKEEFNEKGSACQRSFSGLDLIFMSAIIENEWKLLEKGSL